MTSRQSRDLRPASHDWHFNTGGGSDMLLRGLFLVYLLFVLVGEVYCVYVKINGTRKYEDFPLPYQPHTTKILDCYIDDTIPYQGVIPTWTGSTAQLHVTHRTDFRTGNRIAEYHYNADDITSQTVIKCECDCDQCPSQCHPPVTVTLEGPSPPTTHHSSPPTSSTTPPPSSSSGSATSKPNKFKGVNPLIYTVIAVFLLGTLAVVAIVTCWIRARKTFYRRHRLPQFTTPRDYFDGISDSDFTPLTANQFYASLRDAPPTYHESEVIQASLREDQNNGDSSHDQSPPPLPPRNHNSSSRRNGSPSNGEDPPTQQDEAHNLSPARQMDDEPMLVPTPVLPTGPTSSPNDSLLL